MYVRVWCLLRTYVCMCLCVCMAACCTCMQVIYVRSVLAEKKIRKATRNTAMLLNVELHGVTEGKSSVREKSLKKVSSNLIHKNPIEIKEI